MLLEMPGAVPIHDFLLTGSTMQCLLKGVCVWQVASVLQILLQLSPVGWLHLQHAQTLRCRTEMTKAEPYGCRHL